jgi:hypothetical protein
VYVDVSKEPQRRVRAGSQEGVTEGGKEALIRAKQCTVCASETLVRLSTRRRTIRSSFTYHVRPTRQSDPSCVNIYWRFRSERVNPALMKHLSGLPQSPDPYTCGAVWLCSVRYTRTSELEEQICVCGEQQSPSGIWGPRCGSYV